jgi:hypothetical protein
MELPQDEVQPIEGIFCLVDACESADLVIHCTREGTLQFERLDPFMLKYAPICAGTPRNSSYNNMGLQPQCPKKADSGSSKLVPAEACRPAGPMLTSKLRGCR